MKADVLLNAIATVPPGPWAVGVSGGADSVALLLLLKTRPDLSLHVAHLDHQTRDGESGEDARFVSQLANKLRLSSSIATREQIEAGMVELQNNASSRYRQARIEFFRQTVAAQSLQGVLLAHHLDDQAESILLRLLSGVSALGLHGMADESSVRGLRIRRPLLAVRGRLLRDYLAAQQQSWREDSSNQSDEYARNRARRWLRDRPFMVDELLNIAAASNEASHWVDQFVPLLPETFAVRELNELPLPLSRFAALLWLVKRGVPRREINMKMCERLVQMACDAASPSRQNFPGCVSVRRSRGVITSIQKPFSDGPEGRDHGPLFHR